MIVYRFRNSVNGKSYIGLSNGSLEGRFQGHLSLFLRLRKLRRRMPRFYWALNKYGVDVWEKSILFETDDLEELKAAEVILIDAFGTRDPRFGYNMSKGGDSGLSGMTLEADHKQGIRAGKQAWWDSEAGEKWRNEWSERLRGNNYGSMRKKTKHAPETRRKIGEGNRGKKRTEEQKAAFADEARRRWAAGVYETEARKAANLKSIKKAQESRIGAKQTERQKEAVSKANRKVWEVMFPDGHVEVVDGLRKFCLERGLDPGNLMTTERHWPNRKSKGFCARKKKGAD